MLIHNPTRKHDIQREVAFGILVGAALSAMMLSISRENSSSDFRKLVQRRKGVTGNMQDGYQN